VPRIKTDTPIIVRSGSVDDVRSHGELLLKEHWEEVAKNKHLMVLSPDWKSYYALEEAGKLITLTAWTGPELVGYSVNFFGSHLHYSGLQYAQNDILFVLKKHRATGIGPRLILATESAARQKGCKLMLWHSKQDTALLRLLPKMGYGIQDIVHSKEL
jgi:GNAT superfamily N-acetyltransferase